MSNKYLTNKEFLPEVVKYRETGVASEKFGEMLLKLAWQISNKPSFIGYTWRCDMVSEAVYTCLKYGKKFNPEKQQYPNPFAYFTRIIINSFKAYLNDQKKHSNIKKECYNKKYIIDEWNEFKSIDYTELKEWDEIEENQ